MAVSTRALLGAPVAQQRLHEVRASILSATSRARPPSLTSLHLPGARPFQFYVRRQAKAAQEVGISFREEELPPTTGPQALVDRLRALARDPSVDAVLLEHPLPPPFDFARAVSELPPRKDVDGVSAQSVGLLVGGRPVHVPAVARAALDVARHYELRLSGTQVAVVGRSETVGLPLALLLLGRQAGANATVTIAHSQTGDLRAALAGATVIFSCAGRPGLLDRRVVPRGAAVIDVGLSAVPDPSHPGGSRSVGDANATDLEGWASALSPVPGGVGPVTVAELMMNVVDAWREEVPSR